MSFPSNVHISKHPCLRAKLSQLRSGSTSAKEVKSLVHEIALIVGCEALSVALSSTSGSKVCINLPKLGDMYPFYAICANSIARVMRVSRFRERPILCLCTCAPLAIY